MTRGSSIPAARGSFPVCSRRKIEVFLSKKPIKIPVFMPFQQQEKL